MVDCTKLMRMHDSGIKLIHKGFSRAKNRFVHSWITSFEKIKNLIGNPFGIRVHTSGVRIDDFILFYQPSCRLYFGPSRSGRTSKSVVFFKTSSRFGIRHKNMLHIKNNLFIIFIVDADDIFKFRHQGIPHGHNGLACSSSSSPVFFVKSYFHFQCLGSSFCRPPGLLRTWFRKICKSKG